MSVRNDVTDACWSCRSIRTIGLGKGLKKTAKVPCPCLDPAGSATLNLGGAVQKGPGCLWPMVIRNWAASDVLDPSNPKPRCNQLRHLQTQGDYTAVRRVLLWCPRLLRRSIYFLGELSRNPCTDRQSSVGDQTSELYRVMLRWEGVAN